MDDEVNWLYIKNECGKDIVILCYTEASGSYYELKVENDKNHCSQYSQTTKEYIKYIDIRVHYTYSHET